jgi:GAF domain-containing protein
VPIIFREETLGALEIEAGPGMAVQELVEMAQAVAGRLVQSMETVRLLNQVQKQAQSEQQLNAIVGQIQEMNTIEDMLSAALASVGEAVGADHAAVYLRTRPDDKDQEGGNGHV